MSGAAGPGPRSASARVRGTNRFSTGRAGASLATGAFSVASGASVDVGDGSGVGGFNCAAEDFHSTAFEPVGGTTLGNVGPISAGTAGSGSILITGTGSVASFSGVG